MATAPDNSVSDVATGIDGQIQPFVLHMDLQFGTIAGGRLMPFDQGRYNLVETFLSNNFFGREFDEVFRNYQNRTFQRVQYTASDLHYSRIILTGLFQTDNDLEEFYQSWFHGYLHVSIKNALNKCDFWKCIHLDASFVEVHPLITTEEYAKGKAHFTMENILRQKQPRMGMLPMVHSQGTMVHPQGTTVHPQGTTVHPQGTMVHPQGNLGDGMDVVGSHTPTYAQAAQQGQMSDQGKRDCTPASHGPCQELPPSDETTKPHVPNQELPPSDEATKALQKGDMNAVTGPQVTQPANSNFEEPKAPSVLMKRFIVQIPDKLGQVKAVQLKSRHHELNNLPFSQDSIMPNIWRSQEVHFPVSIEEDVYYQYEVKNKEGLLWRIWHGKAVAEIKESIGRKMRSCTYQRDIFELPHMSYDENVQAQFEGKLVLLMDLLEHNMDTKQCLLECEDMDFPGRDLTWKTVEKLFIWATDYIMEHKYIDRRVLTVFLSVARSVRNTGSLKILLDSSSAKHIISSIKRCNSEDIPGSYIKTIKRWAMELCQLVFGDGTNLLHLMDNFSHLLDTESILELISPHYRKLQSPFETEEGRHLFEKVVPRLVCRKPEVRHLKRLFEHLISQCVTPLNLHYFKDKCLEWTCDESVIKDCLSSLRNHMVTALKKETQNITQEEDMKHVYNMWCKVREDDLFCDPDTVCIFEDALLKKLKSRNFTWTKAAYTMKSFLEDPKMFLCDARGQDVLKLLSESKHACLHILVPKLLAADKFFSMRRDELRKIAKEWMKLAIDVHCKPKTGAASKASDQIPHIYENLLQMIEVPSVKACDNLSEDLAVVAKERIQLMGFSEVLRAQTLENFPDRAQSIFCEHVKEMIQADQSGAGGSLGKFLKELMGSSQSLIIENRYRKEILMALLDKIQVPTEECKGVDGTMKWMKFIMPNRQFWYHIITAEGSMAFLVQKHTSVKDVHEALKNITNSVLKQTISREIFCQLLVLFEKFGDKECFQLLGASASCSDDKVRRSVTEANKIIEKRRKELKDLNALLGFLSNEACNRFRLLGISDFRETVCRHHEELNGASDVSIQNLAQESYWGDYREMCENSSVIYPYLDSKVFVSICLSLMPLHVPPNQNKPEDELIVGTLYDDEPSADSSEIGPTEAHASPHQDKPEDEMIVGTLYEEEPSADSSEIGPTEAHEIDMESFVTEIATNGIEMYGLKFQKLFSGEEIKLQEIEDTFKDCDPLHECELRCKLQKLRLPPPVRHHLKNYGDSRKIEATVKDMETVLLAFKVAIDESSPLGRAIGNFRIYLDETKKMTLTLSQLSNAVDEVRKNSKFDDKMHDVITELSQSQGLLKFLRDVINEDIRNLIDAVEEHSEQFVSESTVSDLIAVKRFIRPLIMSEEEYQTQPEKLFRTLQRCVKEGPVDIPAKLHDCMYNLHSLKALYENVANRGEMTKEIIRNILQGGRFKFKLHDQHFCEASVFYKKHKKTTSHNLNDLHDLRSRALLLGNAEGERKSLKNTEVEKFVAAVDSAQEISTVCTQLHLSGHFNYRKFDRNKLEIWSLEDTLKTLKQDLSEWNVVLEKARNKCYYLNFIHADQLWTLHDYFTHRLVDNSGIEQAEAILSFICPGAKAENTVYDLTPFESHADEGPYKTLVEIGNKLKSYSSDTTPRPIYAAPGQACKKITTVDSTVQPGQLYVATLDRESRQIVPVILELYASTTGFYPEPHQILFANQNTSCEEIKLFLRRCMKLGPPQRTALYCIANVEMLPSEIQFDLADEIHSYLQQNGACENENFLLAIICRGGAHHALVDQFSNFVHRIQGMQDGLLRECLSNLDRSVKVVTSEVPGMGKTERIIQDAARKHQGVVTFPISGPFIQDTIVNRLVNTEINEHQALHISIDAVDDPRALDEFLFELLVIGTVKAGTTIYHLKANNAYIEVGNTVGNHLVNSLRVVMCFETEGLSWRDYNDLQVSEEIASPIQVVCHYLKALDEATLDTRDIILHGEQRPKPLSGGQCQNLLHRYFSSNTDMSFTILDIFINVLADQLKKLSASFFFKASSLDAMLGTTEPQTVRSSLVKALIEVSKEFSSRSIATCREQQSSALSQMDQIQNLQNQKELAADATASMLDRASGMIRWNDSNHLLVFFHSLDFQTISILYRSLGEVPSRIKKLFQTQSKQPLPEMRQLSQQKLSEMLEKIARTKRKTLPSKDLQAMAAAYSLTTDNLLKMALVILRIRARIPVIIMGETGCGKTSLIRYLAMTCEVDLTTLNIHAGVEEEQIHNTIMELDHKAKKDPTNSYWLFLDEINTSQYLGLLSEIICHKSYMGHPLSPNLVCIAACNPYRPRGEHQIYSAGLKGKVKTDSQSKLVYRVYPLPENMIDYVWDYGTLDPVDEEGYITRMVEDVKSANQKRIVGVIVESQRFMRKTEDSAWCVSLRDVHRCKILIKWFMDILPKKRMCPPRKASNSNSVTSHIEVDVKAIILALAHCYYVRLCNASDRNEYVSLVATELYITAGKVFSIIKEEQEELLDRMELPEGIAKNTALRENVFVILVSILNRIPIFVVGKPGCSKSLSMQLIRSNLRGKDSRDPFFKTLPQLYVVSYQGSESSTSDGIEKVFAKAKNYSKHNSASDVLAVVLLDEVGLAEISQHNPLKVLHSLLEPAHGEFPEVAVVGISNWALDAAKMNRAVHLSRPDFDETELFETALSISDIDRKRCSVNVGLVKTTITKNQLKALAKAYYQYQKNQRHPNFHGLRDYYSLIKYVTSSEEVVDDSSIVIDGTEIIWRIKRGILRNFGGLPSEINDIVNLFMEKLGEGCTRDAKVEDLITQNLQDKFSRHLMLITNGDSAVGILERSLKTLGREYEVIFGSQFEEDQQEDYNYRILSRIILCMERGVILILKDLENIYGSLYDMLNQNYTTVGNKRNCRIALGAYSNPMCQVHESFRCIVLVDQSKVDYSDPPFLNRFEKQLLRFGDILDTRQEQLIKDLDTWVNDISTIPGLQFTPEDVFAGYYQDTLASLVARKYPKSDVDILDTHEVVEGCKRKLNLIATPDGMYRATKSTLGKRNHQAVHDAQTTYFQNPLHDGLQSYLDTILTTSNDDEAAIPLFQDAWDNGPGFKVVVMTHSNIHAPVEVQDPFSCQFIKLGIFKSEKHLTTCIRKFWFEDDENLLVLQCRPTEDASHILLAKNIIDICRQEYTQQPNSAKKRKHVCVLVHLDRSSSEMGWQFNFLSGWLLAYVDHLEKPNINLHSLLKDSMVDILKAGDVSLHDTIKQNLLWALSTPITYAGEQPSLNAATQIVCSACKSEDFVSYLGEAVLIWLEENGYAEALSEFESGAWQLNVVCDKQALANSSSLSEALQRCIKERASWPLAMIVYQLESSSAWASFLHDSIDEAKKDQRQKLWQKLFWNPDIMSVSHMQPPLSPGCYVCDSQQLNLKFPFSKVLFARLDHIEPLFKEDCVAIHEDAENFDENDMIRENILTYQQLRFQPSVLECFSEVENEIDSFYCDLLDDFCNLKSLRLAPSLEERSRVQSLKTILLHKIDDNADEDRSSMLTKVILTYWRNKEMFDSILRLLSMVHDILGETDDILSSAVTEYEKQGQMSTEDYDSHQQSTDDFQGNMQSLENMAATDENDAEEATESIPSKDCPPSKPLEQIIVEHVCQRVLPTSHTLQLYGGVIQWHSRINILLQLSAKVMLQSEAGEYPSVLHYLRVCSDYVNILLIPYELLDEYILMDEVHDPEEVMESKELFQQVLCKMRELNDDSKVPPERLQLFLCLYFGRILDADIDTNLFGDIFEMINREKLPDVNLGFFRPVLQRILQAEDDDGTLMFQILDGCEIEENIRLEQLDAVLKENFQDHGWDSSLAALLVDTMSYMYFETTFTKKQDKNTLGDEEIKRIFSSRDHILAAKEISLKLVTSVAFIKGFMFSTDQELEKILEGNDDVKTLADQFSALTQTCSEPEQQERNQIFARLLFKQLRQRHSIADIRHMCKESSEPFVGLKELEKTWVAVDLVPKVGFNPFATSEHYQEAKLAVTTFLVKQETEMLDAFLTTARDSHAHQISLLGILFETFYIVQASRHLTHAEVVAAQQIAGKLHDFPVNVSSLVKCLMGTSDFDCVLLHISTESSDQQVLQATFIIHWLCLLFTSFVGTSVFKSIVTDISAISKTFIPGYQESEGTSDTYQFRKTDALKSTEVYSYRCKCWNRVCFFQGGLIEKFKCPVCQREANLTKEDQFDLVESKNSGSNHEGMIKALDCVRGLSPFAYRLCNLLFHACCLYAPHLTDPEVDSVTSETHMNAFKEAWDQMKIQIQVEDKDLFELLHLTVLEERSTISSAEFDTIANWENEFTKRCSVSLKNWRERNLAYKTQCFEQMGVQLDCIEAEMEEMEKSNTEMKRDFYLPRLFKLTCPATFQLLGANMANLQLPEQYPLLALFFQEHRNLELLQHLPNILNWHKAVTKLLSCRLERKLLKKDLISDILSTKYVESANKLKKLKESFTAFEESWNKLRENAELGIAMPRMHDQLPYADAIIVDHESPIYHVICHLLEIQNHFLGEVQRISVTKYCPAVRFLNHGPGVSLFKEVPVQDSSVQDIISLDMTDEWMRELLKHAQCDTRYGLGKVVHFDYDKIEMELGNELVLGKKFLHMDSTFPMFRFAGEMFFTSENILLDIKKNIKQESLNPDISNGVKQSQDSCPRDTRDLLTSLEVVMSLLKRTGGSPEQSLVGYTDQWLSMLPTPFPKHLLPSPPDLVKLCHIVSLYELVEDLLTESAIKALPDTFRVDLSVEQQRELEPLLKNKDLKLEDFVGAVRKFIFRYTSSSEQSSFADPKKPLVNYLSSSSLWPDGIIGNKMVSKTLHEEKPKELKHYLPESFQVQHVHEVLVYIERTLKQMKDKETKGQTPVKRNLKRNKKLFAKT